MASEYQKWLKLGQELGLVADELKVFVRERQEEVRTERIRQEAVELKRLEIEATDKRLEAEANLKRLEMEAADKPFSAEEKEKDRESNLKRLEIESQERIRIKELDLRLSLERRPEERSVIIGQGDMRADNYGRIRDIQMPVFDELLDDLDAWLHRFQRSCEALRINKDLWVLALVKSLKGPALEVYER